RRRDAAARRGRTRFACHPGRFLPHPDRGTGRTRRRQAAPARRHRAARRQQPDRDRTPWRSRRWPCHGPRCRRGSERPHRPRLLRSMSAGRILITRPEAEAASLVARLRERGMEADAAPMLAIVPQLPDAKDLQTALAGVTALLFTSANGVRAFAAASSRRDFTVYAVGEASAQAAMEAGFTDVTA